MRIIELSMWLIMIAAIVITFFTILVSYGLFYIPYFTTLLPFETSIVLVLLIWGIYNIYNNYSQNKYSIFLSFFIGGLMLLFILFGIY